MSESPDCPKCGSTYTYEDRGIYNCPECNYEWSKDDAASKEDAARIVRDANGVELKDGDTVTVIKDLKDILSPICVSFTRLLVQYLVFLTMIGSIAMTKETVSSYKGSCYCGKVQFEVLGAPLFTQYCHCNKCRSIATKSNREEDKKGYSHTAAYLRKKFQITTGDNYLERLPINNSYLYFCNICKSLIYGISQDKQQNEGIGINMSNFSFDTPDIPVTFKSVRHAYYANRVIDIYDALPKFVNFPLELGGSGERCD